jgi:RimJ/RimL family protein N-acetyltransferase
MEILTERLRLRSFIAADRREYAIMNADRDVMNWLGGPRDYSKSILEMEFNNASLAEFSYGKVAV